MAITEKKTRGLRLPFTKKKKSPSPNDSPDNSPIDLPDDIPTLGNGVPIRPPRPHERQLPPNPLTYEAPGLPSGRGGGDAAAAEARYHHELLRGDFLSNSYTSANEVYQSANAGVNQHASPHSGVPVVREPMPRRPIQQQQQPQMQVPAQNQFQAQSQSQSPPQAQQFQAQQQQRFPPAAPAPTGPLPVPPGPTVAAPQPSPSPLSDEEPLDAYIPEPETAEPEPYEETQILQPADPSRFPGSAISTSTTPPIAEALEIEPTNSHSDSDTGPWTPPDYEPVAPALGKTHYACFQEHKSMPVANNQWYPLPCMTCRKFDKEIRYRCVHCSLRVCRGCFEGLGSRGRDLGVFMDSLN